MTDPRTHSPGRPSSRLPALLTALLVALLVLTVLPASAQTSGRIGAADDPVTAALQLSRDTFGDGEATRVVLGRSDLFPDNLAGAAATAGEGPLLLADPAPQSLAGDVLSEIQRVLGEPSAQTCDERPEDVLVLGGTAAIDESVLTDLRAAGHCPLRLAGDGRVETSVAVASYHLSQFLTPDSGSRGTLLIATGGNPADSAAASAWAARVGAPIVVTESDSLNQAVRDLLIPGDTQWQEVILLGGEAALSSAVEDQVIEALQPGVTTVRRVAGATRDDTAVQVARDLWDTTTVTGAAIVEGFSEDFWTSALTGAVAAARANAPLLYVQPESAPADVPRIPATTDAFLRQSALSDLLTIGPESAISEATRSDAESRLGSGVTPDAPADGYAYLDAGVVYDGEGRALTPPANANVTGFDINQQGDIAVTIDGDLYCICGDGDQSVRELHAPDTAEQLRAPVWTPAGDAVVVLNSFEGLSDLQVVDIGGEDARFITDDGRAGPVLTTQAFTPAGDVYMTADDGMITGVPLDGSGDPFLVTEGLDPVVSPDGSTLLYQGEDGTYALPLDGSGEPELVTTRIGPARFVSDDLVVQIDALGGALYTWDFQGGERLLDEDLPGMVYDLAVHQPTGHVVAANQTSVRLYSIEQVGPIQTLQVEDVQQVRFGTAAGA